MTKTTLIEIVASNTGLKKKDAEAAVNAVFNAIEDELATDGKVQVAGFGTFKIKERAERSGRNPRTNQAITIKATKLPTFIPGKCLKEAVAKD